MYNFQSFFVYVLFIHYLVIMKKIVYTFKTKTNDYYYLSKKKFFSFRTI